MKSVYLLMLSFFGIVEVVSSQTFQNEIFWDVVSKQKAKISTANTQHKLLVFLSPECPMCKSYTILLNELQAQYAKQLIVYGIVPGKAYSDDHIIDFKKKYKITYQLLKDETFALTRFYGVKVTPEVLVLNKDNKKVYQGAIDNWLEGLGKKRNVISKTYLKDAIAESLKHLPVTLSQTEAYGCIINDY